MYNLADNAPAIFKICSFIIILKNIIVHNKQKSVNRHPPFNRSGALVMLGARSLVGETNDNTVDEMRDTRT